MICDAWEHCYRTVAARSRRTNYWKLSLRKLGKQERRSELVSAENSPRRASSGPHKRLVAALWATNLKRIAASLMHRKRPTMDRRLRPDWTSVDKKHVSARRRNQHASRVCWRLCQTPGVSQRRPTISAENSPRRASLWTLQQRDRTTDSPIMPEIDLSARS
jgi:hypothetical protein